MAALNRNAPEWVFFMATLDDQIAKHRRSLESENTKVEELAYERAKLRAVIQIKQRAEEEIGNE